MLSQALQQHSPQHVTALGLHANLLDLSVNVALCHHQRPFQSEAGVSLLPLVCPSSHHSTASSWQALGCRQAAAAIDRLDVALEVHPKLHLESTLTCPTYKATNGLQKTGKADTSNKDKRY